VVRGGGGAGRERGGVLGWGGGGGGGGACPYACSARACFFVCLLMSVHVCVGGALWVVDAGWLLVGGCAGSGGGSGRGCN